MFGVRWIARTCAVRAVPDLHRKRTRSPGSTGATMSDPQINTEAANLGPAWARVAGECTECPTQAGPATRAPYLTGPTREERIQLVEHKMRFSDYGTDLLLQAEQWIYEREIARLGG